MSPSVYHPQRLNLRISNLQGLETEAHICMISMAEYNANFDSHAWSNPVNADDLDLLSTSDNLKYSTSSTGITAARLAPDNTASWLPDQYEVDPYQAMARGHAIEAEIDYLLGQSRSSQLIETQSKPEGLSMRDSSDYSTDSVYRRLWQVPMGTNQQGGIANATGSVMTHGIGLDLQSSTFSAPSGSLSPCPSALADSREGTIPPFGAGSPAPLHPSNPHDSSDIYPPLPSPAGNGVLKLDASGSGPGATQPRKLDASQAFQTGRRYLGNSRRRHLRQSDLHDTGRFHYSTSSDCSAGSAGKVQEPYARLIFRALQSKPSKSMTLQEIYQWFRDKTDKAKHGGKGWQNSIRHNLSMNQAFQKRPGSTSRSATANDLLHQINQDDESKLASIDGKQLAEWYLDPAYYDGVFSTTRYRKKKTDDSSRLLARTCGMADGAIDIDDGDLDARFPSYHQPNYSSARAATRHEDGILKEYAAPSSSPSSSRSYPYGLYTGRRVPGRQISGEPRGSERGTLLPNQGLLDAASELRGWTNHSDSVLRPHMNGPKQMLGSVASGIQLGHNHIIREPTPTDDLHENITSSILGGSSPATLQQWLAGGEHSYPTPHQADSLMTGADMLFRGSPMADFGTGGVRQRHHDQQQQAAGSDILSASKLAPPSPMPSCSGMPEPTGFLEGDYNFGDVLSINAAHKTGCVNLGAAQSSSSGGCLDGHGQNMVLPPLICDREELDLIAMSAYMSPADAHI